MILPCAASGLRRNGEPLRRNRSAAYSTMTRSSMVESRIHGFAGLALRQNSEALRKNV